MKPNTRPNPNGLIGMKKESAEVLRRKAREAKLMGTEEKRIRVLKERERIKKERKMRENQKYVVVKGKPVLISELLAQERIILQREEEQERLKQKTVLVNGKPVPISEFLKIKQGQKLATSIQKARSQSETVQKRNSVKKQGAQISTSTKLVFLASGKKARVVPKK